MLFTITCTSAKNFESWVKKQTEHLNRLTYTRELYYLPQKVKKKNYNVEIISIQEAIHSTVEETINQTGRIIKF